MPDLYASESHAIDAPATKAFAITPDDNNDLPYVTRAIYTGKGGTMVCILAGDTADTVFTDLQPGSILPVRVKRVKETGTTATMNLVGLT